MPGQPGRVICWFRDLLMGRSVTSVPWLRSLDVVSPRSPPSPPSLPTGPAHRLADNYYCSRDKRGAVSPPVVASACKSGRDELSRFVKRVDAELISSEVTFPLTTTPLLPGQGHKWTQSS